MQKKLCLDSYYRKTKSEMIGWNPFSQLELNDMKPSMLIRTSSDRNDHKTSSLEMLLDYTPRIENKFETKMHLRIQYSQRWMA